MLDFKVAKLLKNLLKWEWLCPLGDQHQTHKKVVNKYIKIKQMCLLLGHTLITSFNFDYPLILII